MRKTFKYILFLLIFNISVEANEQLSLQLLWKHQFEFAGFYIAKEKGFYEDVDLDVEIKEFDFGIDIVDDVMSGKSDIGVSRSSIVLQRLRGKDVVLLSTLYQYSPYVLMSLERDDLKTIHDFKDKKIMLSDDLSSIAAISSMMGSKNISSGDYKNIPHSFNLEDLINGKVDLVTTYTSNEPFHLVDKGIKYKLFDPKDYGFDFYADLIFTSEDFLNNNEDKVKKFQEATVKGWEYAFNNVEETIELILSKYNTQGKTKEALRYEAEVLKELAFDDDAKFGHINVNRIQEIANIYRLLGMTKESNKRLDNFVFQPIPLLERLQKLFTLEVILMIISPIILFYLLNLYKQNILQKQKKVLEKSVENKTAELMKYTKDLENQKELYDLVYEGASEGVLFIDLKNGSFVDCNEQIVTMLKGNSKEQVLHMTPAELSPEYQPDGRRSDEKSKAMITKAMEEGSNNFLWKHRRLNGKDFWAEISLIKINIDSKDLMYVAWKDIDEEMQVKEQLQELNETLELKIHERTKELEFAVRAKSDFLANMSHEIRTPLNGIVGFIDMLHKKESDVEKLKKLGIVKESSELLLNIINDILDFSKIESNKLLIEKVPVDLHDIFQHVVELFFSKAKEKDVFIKLTIDEKLPERSLGDSTRIKQILSNILSNAIKFSKHNSDVYVNVKYLENENKLYCEVIDKGVGIEEHQIENIFNSFEQADSSVSRTHGGTGLGLSISKALVELMNGDIGVTSKFGEGSTFYFTIVLYEVVNELVTGTEDNDQEVELKGKVLIVEDNKTNQMLLSMLLDDFNLEYEIANDGLEAIEIVKHNSYDMILMDENMPNMNGIEAAKIIRTFDNYKEIPIIAVTANALKGDKEKFLASGMNGYLAKPIDVDELTSLLSKHL